ncbi:head GIN domain-containing protein [Aureispira sp. CCB-QB1]|uniref:head GIN domain-containing protein n=1 Tax=Aureispira sp. CCB-QB1 TaxID=1313421 RepID=UPI000698871F|nr:head GIN domain-containing protein [Aureispira sp. CCB-QB1]
MKTIFNLSIFALLIVAFSSCDKTSPTITNGYSLSTINKVSIQCACDANIYSGATQKVELTGSEHLLDRAEVYVDGTTLIVKMKPGIYNNMDIVANITIPTVEFVEVKGSGNIWVNDFSGLGDLSLNVSGSGNISTGNLDLGQNKLITDISGSGDVSVSGVAASSYIKISGSGNYAGFGMPVDVSDVKVSGSGNIDVTVNNSLSVDISGSGNVSYKGQPTVNTEITGSGSVINAN